MRTIRIDDALNILETNQRSVSAFDDAVHVLAVTVRLVHANRVTRLDHDEVVRMLGLRTRTRTVYGAGHAVAVPVAVAVAVAFTVTFTVTFPVSSTIVARWNGILGQDKDVVWLVVSTARVRSLAVNVLASEQANIALHIEPITAAA